MLVCKLRLHFSQGYRMVQCIKDSASLSCQTSLLPSLVQSWEITYPRHWIQAFSAECPHSSSIDSKQLAFFFGSFQQLFQFFKPTLVQEIFFLPFHPNRLAIYIFFHKVLPKEPYRLTSGNYCCRQTDTVLTS